MVAFLAINPWTIGLATAAAGAVATYIWVESGGPEATADAIDNAMDAAGDLLGDDDPPVPGIPVDPSAATEAADAAADALTDAEVGDICTTCPDPCLPLKGGVPGSTYRGGAYGHITQSGIQAHHTPANAVSPLSRWNGPAVQMRPEDHAQTMSYRNSAAARAYRAQQQQLIASGNFMGAVAMDVADIRRIATQAGDPARYDGAISQMLAYAGCLKATGQVI